MNLAITVRRLCQTPILNRRFTENALQAHQFSHVFHGRAAVRDYLVVVFFEIELVAEFFLFGSAQIEMCSAITCSQ